MRHWLAGVKGEKVWGPEMPLRFGVLGFLIKCETDCLGDPFVRDLCGGRFTPPSEEGLLGQRSIPTLPPLDVTLLRNNIVSSRH